MKISKEIDINEKFELVTKRFYNKIAWTYSQFIKNSRDKEYAKAYFSDLSPLIFGMPNDEFSLQLYELFNHEYKIGSPIHNIIKQATVLLTALKSKLTDKKENNFPISNFEIDDSDSSNDIEAIPISTSFFDNRNINPHTFFKFFVAYKAKTDFLYFMLREQGELISKEKLQGFPDIISKRIFTDIPNEIIGLEDSNDIKLDIEGKINWLGTQKELGELFVELLQKGWITEIDAKKIQALFSKSNTISQVIKPSQQIIPDEKGNKKLENQYEQIYTAKYQPKFDTIRKNPKKKS